jgi:hypothetical protein
MRRHTIMLWMLLAATAAALWAADITGTWTADVVLDAGSGTATFVFQQKGENLTGSYKGTLGEAKIAGTVKGDQVDWGFDGGEAGQISYSGKLDQSGTAMTGTTQYGLLGAGKFTAKKQ